MKLITKAFASAGALAFSTLLAGAGMAADLSSWGRGSIAEHRPMYGQAYRGPAGPCYFRADVGYSVSLPPTLRWSAWQGDQYNDSVYNPKVDDTWLAEVGAGCGSGSKGFRADFTLGYRGERAVEGKTEAFKFNVADPNGFSSPIKSSLTTYTAMVNGYYDLGMWRGMVPYIGVGIGLAYHQMGDYTITHPNQVANVPWTVTGDADLTLAWSYMIGVAYQVSDRAVLDLGYRYINMGRAQTTRYDNFGQGNLSAFKADDITAQEFKIGLRYHLGGGGGCCAHPVSLK